MLLLDPLIPAILFKIIPLLLNFLLCLLFCFDFMALGVIRNDRISKYWSECNRNWEAGGLSTKGWRAQKTIEDKSYLKKKLINILLFQCHFLKRLSFCHWISFFLSYVSNQLIICVNLFLNSSFCFFHIYPYAITALP